MKRRNSLRKRNGKFGDAIHSGRIFLICLTLIFALGGFAGSMYSAYAAGTVKSGSEKIYTSDLFYAYPAYLSTKNENVTNARSDAETALHNLSTTDEWILKGQTALEEGEDIVIGGIASLFGLDTDMESKCQQKAAEQLLEGLSEYDGAAKQIAEDMKNDQELLKIGKNGYDWYDFFRNYKKSGVNTEAINELENNEEFKKLIDEEAVSTGMDMVEVAVDAQEAIAMITMLEGIQQEEIQYLVDHLSDELAAPVRKYQTYIKNNYQDYLAKKYINKYTYEEFVNIKTLLKTIQPEGSGYAAAYSVVKTFCKFIAKAESIITGLGSASDYVVAEILQRYVGELSRDLNDQRSSIATDPVYPGMIKEYELGYGIYLASVCAFADAAKTVNTDYKEELEADIENLKKMTIQDHYEDCKAKILSDAADERNVKKVDPEKTYNFYSKDGIITVAGPTDDMKSDEIYTGNSLVHYSISLDKGAQLHVDTDANMQNISSYMGKVTFKSGKEVTVNNLVNSGGTFTNESGTKLHVLDTVTGRGNGYPTATYSNSYFVNNGNIVIDGKLFGDGEYGVYSYSAEEHVFLTSDPDATLTVNGDALNFTVSRSGKYDLYGGVNLLLGDSVNGADAMFTVHAPTKKSVRLGSLNFTPYEDGTTGCDIVYVYDSANNSYDLKGSGKEYTVSGGDSKVDYRIDSPSSFGKFSVNGIWTINTTLYADGFAVDRYGLLNVEANALLKIKDRLSLNRGKVLIKSNGKADAGSIYMDGADFTISENAELHVSGDVTPHGNNYQTDGARSYIHNYGKMLIDGSLIGDGSYGTYSYSGDSVSFSTLEKGSYTEVKGNISDHSVTLSGEAVFYGAVGLYSSDITKTGKLYVHAPAGAGVAFANVRFTPSEEAASGCELVMIQNPEDSAYEITVEAPDCNVSSGSSGLRRFTGKSAVGNLSLSGEWNVAGEVTGKALSPGTFKVVSGGKMSITELSLYGPATIDKGGELIIKDKAVLRGNDYYTDGRKSYLYNYGRLIIEGEIYGYGSYGQYTYSGSSVAFLNGLAGSYTEISGKMSDISVSIEGDFMFTGVVDHSVLFPKATGSIEVDSRPGETVKMGKLIFTPVEGAQTGCKMKMTYDSENKRYNVSFNAPEYDLSTYKNSDPDYCVTDDSLINRMTIAETWYVQKDIHIAGDLSSGSSGRFRMGDEAVIDLCGNGEQHVFFSKPENSTLSNLSISNASDEGVVFDSGFKVTRLFDHQQNNFELKAAGTFPDFDGDGSIDSEDYEPADEHVKGVSLTVTSAASGEGGDAVTVTRPDGRVLRDKIDYTTELDDNSKVIVHGRQIYTNCVLLCEHKKLDHVAAVGSTCIEAGNTEYWICADCGKCFSDKDGNTEIEKNSWILPKAPHTWDDGTVTTEPTYDSEGVRTYKCINEGCSETRTETIGKLDHEYSDEWTTDDDNHWHACTHENCESVDAFGSHDWIIQEERPASCAKEGETKYVCSVCSKVRTETIPVKKHVLNHIEAKEATTTSAGNVEYWKCSGCDTCFSDAEGNTVIRAEDTVIPKKGGVGGDTSGGANKAETGSAAGNTAATGYVTNSDGTFAAASGNTAVFTQADKSKKSITIPDTVNISGGSCKVTAVASTAFKGSKATSVTIGRNVKTIKKNAFSGSNVKTINVKTKSLTKSSVKGCLKGSKVKTIKVKVGRKSDNVKYMKKYKKIFTKKNAGRTVSVK